jgi:anti-sigma-K factor RskA
MSETGDLDTLAAEYVLGTLDGPERAQAQAVLGVDEAFAAKVRIWERRLGELHLMVEPVEPDGEIWVRIKAKMPAPEPSQEIKPPEPEAAEPKESLTPGADTTSAAAAVAAPIPSPVTVPPTPPTAPTTPVPTPSAEPAAKLPPAPVLPVPAPPPAVARAAMVERERADDNLALRRRLRRWRAFAALLILVVLAAGALVAAWKYAPERVPPALQATELLRVVGITVAPSGPVRRPAPPESQFDE